MTLWPQECPIGSLWMTYRNTANYSPRTSMTVDLTSRASQKTVMSLQSKWIWSWGTQPRGLIWDFLEYCEESIELTVWVSLIRIKSLMICGKGVHFITRVSRVQLFIQTKKELFNLTNLSRYSSRKTKSFLIVHFLGRNHQFQERKLNHLRLKLKNLTQKLAFLWKLIQWKDDCHL